MWENIHLCLSDLLDQDLSSFEYFNSLSEEIKQELLTKDSICSFEELQETVAQLKQYPHS